MPHDCTIEEQTLSLRWSRKAHEPILQQKWLVRQYRNGVLLKAHESWRDVPTEE